MKAGDTFHAQSPSSTRPHLYIVLTDPAADGTIVIANVTSREPDKDQSCILNIGDHPFLRKESVINYAEALPVKEEAVLAAARGRVVQHDVAVSEEVLARVQAGALASPHTESKVKAAVKAALGR